MYCYKFFIVRRQHLSSAMHIVVIVLSNKLCSMYTYKLGGHHIAEKKRPMTDPSCSKILTGTFCERLLDTRTSSPRRALIHYKNVENI